MEKLHNFQFVCFDRITISLENALSELALNVGKCFELVWFKWTFRNYLPSIRIRFVKLAA